MQDTLVTCRFCKDTGEIRDSVTGRYHYCTCHAGVRARTIRDAACIADGTLGSITGRSRYDELNVIRGDWIEWLQKQPDAFPNWQTAWEAYQQATR